VVASILFLIPFTFKNSFLQQLANPSEKDTWFNSVSVG